MTNISYTAWDIGGAHLKVANIAADGTVLAVAQQPCPLWKGMDRLCEALQTLLGRMAVQRTAHAITMTGELADIFTNREEGVHAILNTLKHALPADQLQVYAGQDGLLNLPQAYIRPHRVASANWLATAEYVAACTPQALLVDMGSTTTDIIPVRGGKPAVQASDDAGRMRSEELIYSGVIRTPVMAITQRVMFDAQWHSLAAEHFATAGDVYRLTGELKPQEDMEDTADGRGKSIEESARRLARMLGMDYEHAEPHQWVGLARAISRQQLFSISRSIEKALSHQLYDPTSPIVGAGVGRFLIREIAQQLQRPYIDIAEYFEMGDESPGMAAVCAPAVSLAYLLRSSLQ